MIQPEEQPGANGPPPNGTAGLEARLRQLFGEQQRLRELLDRTRQQLDDLAAELFRFQDEYCTDAAREEEYDSALERILGINPRIDLKEVEEILAGKRKCDMGEFIEELERTIEATPSQGAE
ncbi:MAG TPA: hypothetical protein VMS17_13195 [Gemmataceae bacterium]|nr:hypothetical protein [Gemmataceae bacterium]